MEQRRTKEHTISSTVTMHCHFYRDQYRRLVIITGLVLLINLAFGLVITFLLLDKPSDIYVPAMIVTKPSRNLSATDFTITPRIPLNRPNLEKMELAQWIYEAIRDSFTFNLQTYKTQLNNNTHYYTDSGWQAYTEILDDMVRLDQLTRAETLVSIVRPTEAPSLYDAGVVDGTYTWIYDFPISVEFFGTTNTPNQSMTLRITLVRTSMAEDIDGIKIDNISATNIKRRPGVAGIPVPFG